MSSGHRHGTRECREMFAQLSEYLDGELDGDVCDQIEEHMGDCTPCQAFLENFRGTIEAISGAGPKTVDPQLRKRIVEDYRKLKSSLGGTETPHGS